MDGRYTNLNEREQQAVEHLLAAFDNNTVKAISAVRDYLHEAPATSPKAPAVSHTGTPLISIKNLQKSYKIGKQKVQAVNDISLDIYEGEFIAITGASGSGKSTLLQLIGGLDKPSSGEIIIDGTNIAKMSDGKLSTFRNQTIGFVFQFFYLQPFLRVRKNIEVPAMFAGTKRALRTPAIEAIAAAVGLSDRLTHLPRELSGGQMQRVAIARALLNQPKILLADEPTGNLDSTTSKAIVDIFRKIRDDLKTTVVIVTHDPDIARQADREIKVSDGKLL